MKVPGTHPCQERKDGAPSVVVKSTSKWTDHPPMKPPLRNVIRVSFLIMMVVASSLGQESHCSLDLKPGQWSKHALDISPPAPSRQQSLRVCAPDGKSVVLVQNERWSVEVNGRKLAVNAKRAQLAPYSELSWAPDSRAFYLTESEGYSSGYETTIYLIRKAHIEPVSGVTRVVTTKFERRHRCSYSYEGADVGNRPNVAGLAWSDARHLVMIAEVPPIGICKGMGYFGGFSYSIDVRSTQGSYSPKQLSDEWHDSFGPRLADDDMHLSQQEQLAVP